MPDTSAGSHGFWVDEDDVELLEELDALPGDRSELLEELRIHTGAARALDNVEDTDPITEWELRPLRATVQTAMLEHFREK